MRILPTAAVAMTAALATPVAGRDWLAGAPFIDRETSRSLDDISGCISTAWQERSGQTTYVPSADGFTMRLSYSVLSRSIVAVQVDVTSADGKRRVIVHARSGDRKDKLRREVSGCL